MGGVADEGGGAPYIGGKDLRHQEGQGMDLQSDGDLDGHRDHQEHGGDIVQESRGHRGDHHEDGGQDEDVTPGQGVGLVGQPLEHARLF